MQVVYGSVAADAHATTMAADKILVGVFDGTFISFILVLVRLCALVNVGKNVAASGCRSPRPVTWLAHLS